MKYDLICIGAGLGGLVTSALAARDGLRVLLLEQHCIPGGYCTSYDRRGYTCSVPSVMNDLGDPDIARALDELGFYDQIRWHRLKRVVRFVAPGLDTVLPAGDLQGCREAIASAFPGERPAIEGFFGDLDRVRRILRQAAAPGGLRRALGLVGAFGWLCRLVRTSFQDYLRGRTSNPRLVEVLGMFWPYGGLPPGKLSAAALLLITQACLGEPTRYPEQGYQAVADHLATRVLGWGGEIRYRTRASRILLESGRAVGVEVEHGELLRGSRIVCGSDTVATLKDLLPQDQLPRSLVARAKKHKPSASGVTVHLGTPQSLEPRDWAVGQLFFRESWRDSTEWYDAALSGELDLRSEPIQLGLQAPSMLAPELAPPGRNLVHLMLFPYRVTASGPAYLQAKRDLAQVLVQKADRLLPGLSLGATVLDVATPRTFERYTGATGGAWYDGVWSAEGPVPKPSARTPIEAIYLTGTRAGGGGGLPLALRGGVLAHQAVLQDQARRRRSWSVPWPKARLSFARPVSRLLPVPEGLRLQGARAELLGESPTFSQDSATLTGEF